MPFTSETAKIAGKIGGLRTKERMTAKDPDYFSKLGMSGGSLMTKIYGPDYFSRLGKMKKHTKKIT